MAFELYRRTRATGEKDEVSLTAAGLFSFSASLTAKALENVEFVQFLYDSASKRIGVRPAKEGDEFAFRLIRPTGGKRAAVSGRGFLKSHSIGTEKAGKFIPKTVEGKWDGSMIVFRIT